MARPNKNQLPRYLELHTVSQSHYYKNPGMPRKANLGRDRLTAVRMANLLNTEYRIQQEQETMRLEAAVDLGSPLFSTALDEFVEKYFTDYRLKSSTSALLRQRRSRLAKQLGNVQVAKIDTQMLREAITSCSQFEQSKMKTLLVRSSDMPNRTAPILHTR